MKSYWIITYHVNQDEVEIEVIDNKSGKYRVLSHTEKDELIAIEDYAPETIIWRVEEVRGRIISSQKVHTIIGWDFSGMPRKEMESFFSAFINFANNLKVTFIDTTDEIMEFITTNTNK